MASRRSASCSTRSRRASGRFTRGPRSPARGSPAGALGWSTGLAFGRTVASRRLVPYGRTVDSRGLADYGSTSPKHSPPDPVGAHGETPPPDDDEEPHAHPVSSTTVRTEASIPKLPPVSQAGPVNWRAKPPRRAAGPGHSVHRPLDHVPREVEADRPPQGPGDGVEGREEECRFERDRLAALDRHEHGEPHDDGHELGEPGQEPRPQEPRLDEEGDANQGQDDERHRGDEGEESHTGREAPAM